MTESTQVGRTELDRDARVVELPRCAVVVLSGDKRGQESVLGGDVFEACLFAMKTHGRIACCGAVSQYDGAAPPHGPRGVPGQIVTKRLTLRGFVVMDFADQNAKALADLQAWVKDGRLKVQEDIIDGLENLPDALIGLLHGENRGKRMVRV